MKRTLIPSSKLLSTAALFVAAAMIAPSALADPPIQYKIENNELKVSGPILWETASDKLKPDSDAVLEYVRGYLEAKSYITMRVENHSDSDGNANASQALSEKRALAVARWLVGHGIDCKRVIPVGFGGSKPIAANDSPEHKAQNRRTTFVNAMLRGHAIGGMPTDGGGKLAGDPCTK